MVDNGKTFDSSVSRRAGSKLDRDQRWVRLLAEYLRDLPQQLDGIGKVLDTEDYTTVKKHAHRIKGTSGTYGLAAISEGAARLERLADSRDPDAIVATINKVKRLVELETQRVSSQTVASADNCERDANV